MKKKILAVALAFAMAFTPVTYSKAQEDKQIETTIFTKGESYTGSNVEAQNYSTWSKPIKSYLTTTASGELMRVQAGDNIDGVIVEYYTSDYALKFTKKIPAELPVFGGFYENENGYFIVTGQNNPEEKADVECFRITKYDKDWHRISSAGIYDCNTTIPFRAGSLRMTSVGKYLLIRTSHEMYKNEDGYNHQANVTIEVDTDSMTVTDSFFGVMSSSVGYVSHSFNQFIEIEDNKIVSIDHGDAYPRAITMLKYKTDVTTGKFFPDYFTQSCDRIDVLNFPGSIGNNYTGASVGGFELSDNGYIVAANSVIQDENASKRTSRNVFVSSISKSGEVVNTWLSDYTEGNGTVSTPQLVKISGNEFVVIWSVSGKVQYVKVNAAGEKISDVYSMAGNLSDCKPIVVNNKIVWYTWSNEKVKFYEVGINNLGANNVVETVDESVTLNATGIYVAENKDRILAGLCTEITKDMPLEYSWYLLNSDNTWSCLKDWTQGDEWLDWTPSTWGDYTLVAKVRIKDMPVSETEYMSQIGYHPYIKGICQMPYEGEGGGYLIGFETYDNPWQSYSYEMLILDCTLLAEGKDAWIHTTTPCHVAEGNAFWTVWQPQYGYYWTLFRVYDAFGNLLDQECYGFVNAY